MHHHFSFLLLCAFHVSFLFSWTSIARAVATATAVAIAAVSPVVVVALLLLFLKCTLHSRV